MTGFVRNIDCLVLEVYKYTRKFTFPSLDLIQMELPVYLYNFQYTVIVHSFDTIIPDRKMFKKCLQISYEISFERCKLHNLRELLLSNLTK